MRRQPNFWAKPSDYHPAATALGSAVHEVDDVDHWAASPKRDELFGPMGITVRAFRDPETPNRVGVIFDGVSDLETFAQSLQTDEAAEAMKHDGVRPETIVTMIEV